MTPIKLANQIRLTHNLLKRLVEQKQYTILAKHTTCFAEITAIFLCLSWKHYSLCFVRTIPWLLFFMDRTKTHFKNEPLPHPSHTHWLISTKPLSENSTIPAASHLPNLTPAWTFTAFDNCRPSCARPFSVSAFSQLMDSSPPSILWRLNKFCGYAVAGVQDVQLSQATPHECMRRETWTGLKWRRRHARQWTAVCWWQIQEPLVRISETLYDHLAWPLIRRVIFLHVASMHRPACGTCSRWAHPQTMGTWKAWRVKLRELSERMVEVLPKCVSDLYTTATAYDLLGFICLRRMDVPVRRCGHLTIRNRLVRWSVGR